jgi:hypothetical protein
MGEESVLVFLKEAFLKDFYSNNLIPNTEKTEKIKLILKSEQSNIFLINMLLRLRIRRLKRTIRV